MTATEHTTKVFVQVTNGKIHHRKNCSVTNRTRYSHGEAEMTTDQLASANKCEKCWK